MFMLNGVIAELNELIDLRRYVQSAYYHPQGKAIRSGNHLSKLRGRGMDFADVRNYQAGDEIRHMEWRVTARTGKPHVKIYQEERERPVIILTDFNPSMIFGTRIAFKSVIAARLAALLSWTVIKRGDRVGGVFFSATDHSEFTPRTRDMGVLPLLASLSQYTQQTEEQRETQPKPLSEALERLRFVMRPGSILILISDFYAMNNDCEQHLKRLRAHNDILAYHICDRIELSPPKPQQYAITNGIQEIMLNTRLRSVSTAYQDYCQHRIENLQDQLRRVHIPYVQVHADLDLAQLVRHTFLRRNRG
jgi:uncharacterized protein (DUF58 family)